MPNKLIAEAGTREIAIEALLASARRSPWCGPRRRHEMPESGRNRIPNAQWREYSSHLIATVRGLG